MQKDTILLNYCMDDIERFYTDLRCIDDEAQGRQTEKSATDFVNIFQKFKLAFNLMVSRFNFAIPICSKYCPFQILVCILTFDFDFREGWKNF